MRHDSDHDRSEAVLLYLEDLWPFMAFSNLHHLELNVECNMYLTDNDLLTLASAWPRLESLQINSDRGWKLQCGITPGGLV